MVSENCNPNVSSSSPAIKSAKISVSKNPNPNPNLMVSQRNKIQERRFVIAKKNLKKDNLASKVLYKCKEKYGRNGLNKCLCTAYKILRASQEEFFKNRGGGEEEEEEEDSKRAEIGGEGGEEEKKCLVEDLEFRDGYEGKVEEDDDFVVI